ncbi:hypothetical protein SAMN02982929_07240 [Saccharopolyspora kobensis]|uniref:Uncharacterized protein n=1 Tax=Saccharopolyspora kobensis TaxID=146035 RepID=A0A1H6EP50_9PSEU|nr:hypothetical protein [Saccharopolyspora kobensis]SEG98871.1 hypothetical protein SAMN02982929_07240 [Saccharopolyspora kobensis]SFD23236.1 hypothetical protein SAMN05216506_103159 [Saccharopolyspora kobensis]
MPLYLGPLGGLVQIHPLTDIDIDPQRFGGTHTAITGRRTVDYLGSADSYTLRWRHRTPSEMRFLHAIHRRHIPGPLRLILGDLMPNRLSRSAASLGFGGRDMSGIELMTGFATPSTLYPSAAGVPGLSLLWSGWTTAAMSLDYNSPAPVFPGETVTASVWVMSPAGDDAVFGVNHHGATGDLNTPTANPVVTLAANTWTRLSITLTPGATTWGLSGALQLMTNRGAAELYMAAAQIEVGAVAGDWNPGGGAPVVAVDSMTLPSPYGHFTDPELTLLEV